MVEKALSEEQRKQVFLDLVVAQDHDMSVLQSRKHIAARYDVSEAQSGTCSAQPTYDIPF